MGGSGSGNWFRGGKSTVEEYLDIDIRWMARRGYLNPGRYTTLTWSCNGKPSGTISTTAGESSLTLSYQIRDSSDHKWESIRYPVRIEHTPCYYGGTRIWFRCPRCDKRVALLYGGKYFYCRTCQNLNYKSQHEAPPGRLLLKAQRLQKRLGYDGPTLGARPSKPKGMHWKTYRKLMFRMKESDFMALSLAVEMYC